VPVICLSNAYFPVPLLRDEVTLDSVCLPAFGQNVVRYFVMSSACAFASRNWQDEFCLVDIDIAIISVTTILHYEQAAKRFLEKGCARSWLKSRMDAGIPRTPGILSPQQKTHGCQVCWFGLGLELQKPGLEKDGDM